MKIHEMQVILKESALFSSVPPPEIWEKIFK
jgi:hypothetical protein